MAVAGWQVHAAFTGTLPRLIAGGVACGVCTLIAMAMLMPVARQTALAYVRSRVSLARRT
jgi:hypothetical protein